MNKYQEAIAIRNAYIQTESGTKCLDDYYKESFDTLQELVDKETPKKVKPFPNSFYIKTCPNCSSTLETKRNYCDNCGQRLDWGDEDE